MRTDKATTWLDLYWIIIPSASEPSIVTADTAVILCVHLQALQEGHNRIEKKKLDKPISNWTIEVSWDRGLLGNQEDFFYQAN